MNELLGRLGALTCLAAGIAVTTGCGSDAKGPAEAPEKKNLAVTADYLHHTLSFLDFDAMVTNPDATTADRLGELDLSQYTQPAYGLKITPDRRTAVVTLSAGFFVVPGASSLLLGDSTVPTGPSKVLLVDIESRSLRTELDTGDNAAGIAISHDGRRAYVTHTTTNDLSIIDIEAGELVEQVDIGGSFAEAVAVDETDTVGIVTCLDDGLSKSARTFALADVVGTLSDPIPLKNDAAGVAFFPGTKTALVVLAYTPLLSPVSGYVLVDGSDPRAPVKLSEERWTDAIYVAFDAFPVAERGTVFMPVSAGGTIKMREYALGSGALSIENSWDVATVAGFGPFGTALDEKGRMLMTYPGDHKLGVFDLRDGSSFSVPWFTEPSPMGIALY